LTKRVVQIGLQNGMVEWYKSGVKQGICVIDSGEVDHEHEVNPQHKLCVTFSGNVNINYRLPIKVY
jgi:hypothetical protein